MFTCFAHHLGLEAFPSIRITPHGCLANLESWKYGSHALKCNIIEVGHLRVNRRYSNSYWHTIELLAVMAIVDTLLRQKYQFLKIRRPSLFKQCSMESHVFGIMLNSVDITSQLQLVRFRLTSSRISKLSYPRLRNLADSRIPHPNCKQFLEQSRSQHLGSLGIQGFNQDLECARLRIHKY